MHQSHWGRAGLARTSYGHALTVAVPGTVDADRVAATLDSACRSWWGPAVLPTRLWTEGTHSGWGSEEARRRVDAEMLRSRPPDGPVLRAVLLRHADPPFELVVTADRRDLDRTALAIVCDVLLGTIGADTVAADPVRRHEDGRILVADARARRSTRVWRTPDGVLLGPEPWDRGDSDLTTAVAVAAATVAGRYEALDSVSVPVWRVDPDRPRNVLGGYEHCVCLTIDTSGARTAYEVLPEAVRARHRRRPLDAAEAYGPGGVAASLVGVLGAVPREFERVYLPCQSAPFPLTLVPFVDSDGRATLEVYADPAKVGEATAVRFGLRVAEVVRALSTTPKTPARHRGSVIFGTVDPAPVGAGVRPSLESAEQRIEDLFAAHVRARPDAIAVTHGRRTLTYAELDERSRWVSGGLQELGVTAGDRVGICLDRSVDLIVVMLAVLRTGAGFVPMDVRHPPKRLADTARDAGVRLVVGELEDSAWSDGVPVVSPRDLEMSEPGRSDVVGHGEATAYVIYTSGSTGRPKGVAVPHRAVLALLAATTEEFALTPDDTWSLFHSPAFDFSVWEIWGALLTGARIVIVPYWISRSPVEFHTLLSDEHVTILSQTPSAFTHLVAADPGLDPLDSVRLVVFGGETLDPRAVLPWLDRYPESSCRLVNMYGTTETTVHVTARTVTRRDALSGSRSVGLPLRGWEIHVVDEDGRPLPRGMAGEIVVGGVGVSHGYLNRRGLTATRFVAAPGGGRRYRTGDRGRLHDDGTLEHLGRLDTQVQIRGFRVELGEIRGVLLTDPAVTAAAVVSSGGADGAGDLTIDAYVVLAEDTSSSATTIRRGLARLLPEHMMPRTVTELAALPLGVNGKLDTARLPDPAPGSREARRRRSRGVPEPDGARGMAGTLTDIWESVLGVSVSPDDNLFELGGNSLCAIKAETMMRRLGLPGLPMRELYRHPSIRGICDALARLYPPRPDT